MDEKNTNSRACNVSLKITGWTLRRFPKVEFEGCILIPHRVSDPETFTGKAQPGVSGKLIVSATAGQGQAMLNAVDSANAKALRAADLLSQGKEIPKGRIAEEYETAAKAARAAILKEEGLSEEAYVALLDAFIMAANPPGPKTLHSTIIEPEASQHVLVRVSFTDDVNMSAFLSRFPNSVLESGAGTDAEQTVREAYDKFLVTARKAKIEKDLEKIRGQQEKAQARVQTLQAKQAELAAKVSS